MLTLLRKCRTWRLARALEAQARFYARDWSLEGINRWQLARFNERWRNARTSVPYYRALAGERDLPHRFSSWSDVRNLLPVLDRATVQERGNDLRHEGRTRSAYRTTGGSTGQPLRIPVWPSEARLAAEDMWYARSWFRIVPHDRACLLWGHAHLMGRGYLRVPRRGAQWLRDRALGYLRLSAYDLGHDAMRRAGDALLRQRPDYMIAYAGALLTLAEVNRDRSVDFRALRLKAAIATAESFPRSDAPLVVSRILGCPVPMEYGTVETGPIAHERPSGGFAVFWRRYRVEIADPPDEDGGRRILVSSLFPRCFPLFRYDVGDRIEGDPEHVTHFRRVLGRRNDFVILEGGRRVHSEAFSHALKESRRIRDFHVLQKTDRRIEVWCVAAGGEAPSELSNVRDRLASVHPDLRQVDFRWVNELPRSVAGKTKRIVSSAAAPPMGNNKLQSNE